MVIEKYSQVKNSGISIPSVPTLPFTESDVNRIAYVVPLKESRELVLIWALPEQRSKFETKPSHYIAHLIGHEGKGSILSILKSVGWANELCAGK